MWFLPKDYVWVHTRVEQFHKDYPSGSITTSYDFHWDTVIFKATVIKNKDGVATNSNMNDIFTWKFNWTSFWSVKKDKALEKLETVAVGRALAFAGFEVKSWIASREEMENLQDNQKAPAKIDRKKFTMTNLRKLHASLKAGDIKVKDFDELITLIKNTHYIEEDIMIDLEAYKDERFPNKTKND